MEGQEEDMKSFDIGHESVVDAETGLRGILQGEGSRSMSSRSMASSSSNHESGVEVEDKSSPETPPLSARSLNRPNRCSLIRMYRVS